LCFYAFADYVSQKKGRLVFVNSNAVAFWTFKLGKSNLISILVHLTKLPEQWKSMNVHGQLWLFFSNKNGIDPLYGPSFAKSIELGMLIMCAQLLHPFLFFFNNFQFSNYTKKYPILLQWNQGYVIIIFTSTWFIFV
jgi:hypothetical protein